MKRRKSIWYVLKLILKAILVIAVFGGIFSYAMFQGGFVSWFLFYSTTILVILMAVYILIPLGSFRVSREMGDTAIIAGSELTVKVKISRKLPFPFLYLSVRDKLGKGLSSQLLSNDSKTIFYPSVKRELEYTYVISNVKRGDYFFHGVHLETSDMFGLFKKRKWVPIEESLLVYPNYHDIERWSAYERHETETHLSSMDFIEDITSIAGAREYVPGDKLTSIDWKVTARASKLMTKEFEEHIGQDFQIVFNNFIPDNRNLTFEAYEKAIELVTSLVMHANQKQLKLGLWTLGKESKSFSLGTGTDHQKRIVYHLSKIQADDTGDFTIRLKEFEDQIIGGTTLFFVSTELTDTLLERLRIYLSRRNQVYFCLLDRGQETNHWEQKKFEELKRYGAEAYILSEGSLDEAIHMTSSD